MAKAAVKPKASKIEVFEDIEQGTPEWFEVRRGLVTASKFGTVMATGRGGGESKTRAKYMRELAGEIITGQPMESYTNAHMERGKVMEDAIRAQYAFEHDEFEIKRVGFIKNGNKGVSPDSLLGNAGMLEIKSALPDILIDILMAGRYPPEHKPQCQGALWVAEREWIDICVGWRKEGGRPMPLYRERIYRDEPYIAAMAREVSAFNAELRELVAKVEAMS